VLDASTIKYKYSEVKEVDFSSFIDESKKGSISYYVAYYDSVNNQELDNNFAFPSYGTGALYYEITDENTITFSEKKN